MGEVGEEILETDPLPIELISYIDEFLEDKLMTLVIAESLSSCYDFSNISLAASICVEIEEGEEIFDLFLVEGGVFGDYWFGKDLLSFLLDESFPVDRAHWIFPSQYILSIGMFVHHLAAAAAAAASASLASLFSSFSFSFLS